MKKETRPNLTGPEKKPKGLIPILAVTLLALVYVLLLVWVNSGFDGYTTSPTHGREFETATVEAILADNTVSDDTIEGRRRGSMDLLLRITSGRYKGDEVELTNYLSPRYNVDVREGDSVSVQIITVGEGEYQVSIHEYNRAPWLMGFIVLFAVALVILGGKQGLFAFLGLVFTFVNVIYLLVPLTLRGWPSVPITIGLVAVTSLVCFWLLGGIQPKTISAALGCLCGVAFAAVLGWGASALVHISAYQMDEWEQLMLIQNETELQMSGLFLSGILISSLGAVMDIAMSVASAMTEVKQKVPAISRKELFRSGLRVGRDATGTMANTLVLAIAGSSFNMMLLIYSWQTSFGELMNSPWITLELIRGIAGSMGILLTVPCVALIAAFLLTREKKNKTPAKQPSSGKGAV